MNEKSMNFSDLEEKKELVVMSYSATFDKEMAYSKVDLTPDEIQFLENDVQFQKRLNLFLIQERERIIKNLRDFMESTDERISFRATMDMAQILYPDFFKRGNIDVPEDDFEDDKRLIKEYEKLLGKKDYFKTFN